MILSDKTTGNKKNRETRWMVLFGILMLALLLFLIKPSKKSNTINPQPDLIFCDAETVQEDQFISDIHLFDKGKLQSDEQAHSGTYSCKVGLGKSAQYGFSYQLKDFSPGEVYRASVWRYKTIHPDGSLVVEGKGNDSFYKQQASPIQTELSGWEKLEITFHLPFGQELEQISFYVYASGQTVVYFDDFVIQKIADWPQGIFRPEVLKLELDQKALNELSQKREKAIKTGILEVDQNDWVEANLQDSSNTTIPIKIRLKGDWLDHLQGDKWSFRIKIRDPNNWRRLKTFSLHTPTARNGLHEWLLHQLWEKEDVLTTRYDFVELHLNGKSLGIYAYEEHFEKQLVEYKQRREGPIVKFSEAALWSGIKRQLTHHGFLKPGATHPTQDRYNAQIEAFREDNLAANPALAKQFEAAQALMYSFRSGQKKPAEIFDIALLAKYYAICDVLNAYHGIVWHNQRFYYNPVTAKLEPVGFDGFGEKPPVQYSFLGQGALHPGGLAGNTIFSYLFLDPDFVKTYTKYLFEFSSKEYLQNFFDEVLMDWSARLQMLQLEFPSHRPNFFELMMQAQYIHSLILPFNDHSIKTHLLSKEKGLKTISIENTHGLPLEVIGYGVNNKIINTPLETPVNLPGQLPRQVLNRLKKDSIIRNFDQIRFLEEVAFQNQEPPLFKELELPSSAQFLFYQLPGIDSIFHTKISTWIAPYKKTLPPNLQTDNLLPSPFFTVSNQLVTFKKGIAQMEKDVIIPSGYQVLVEAGTTLDLINGAAIISYSPLQMFGSEEAPIKIISSDKSGNGLTVLQANAPSVLKHVLFDQLNTLKKGDWELTGAVTFYESEVDFYRCIFRNSQCEDALNIIRSNFKVDYCHFSNTLFDAFDSDFCKGKVTNSYFYETGNDGMDFSGSIVTIQDCQLENCRDKGISVGEESDVSVFSTSIKNCPIALAAKDLSVLLVRDISLEDCDQGFVAFQKKPEYGGSQIIVESYQAENLRRLHAISQGSYLQLIDQLIQ